MTRNEYNGWYNYETWVVALWMDNEQGTQEYWLERAGECLKSASRNEDDEATIDHNASYELSQLIKSEHEEAAPVETGVFADLQNAALSEVNWDEIATRFIEQAKEEVES